MKAELCYTRDTTHWQDRTWITIPADIDFEKRRIRATIPEGTRVYYLNVIDEQGLIISTEHGIREPDRSMNPANAPESALNGSGILPHRLKLVEAGARHR